MVRVQGEGAAVGQIEGRGGRAWRAVSWSLRAEGDGGEGPVSVVRGTLPP
ncbi:hypothetical protein SFR_3854 [Streptomyces sp. FR-008]|nr:hypothetical protein SFR_3854 [Streptomyces sp. FR-008]